MASFIDKIAGKIAQVSCSVYEDQPLCRAARGHEKKEAIDNRSKWEHEWIEARQRERAMIKERSEALVAAIERCPECFDFEKRVLMGPRKATLSELRFLEGYFTLPSEWPFGLGPVKK